MTAYVQLYKLQNHSRYRQRTATVKQSGSNFMVDHVPLGRGGFVYVEEETPCKPSEATHVRIRGISHDPTTNCYHQKYYTGLYYSHDFKYPLSECPELQQWVEVAPFSNSIETGFSTLYVPDLMECSSLPPILQSIIKGWARFERIQYDHFTEMGVTQERYILSEIEWAESLPVEPLIYIEES